MSRHIDHIVVAVRDLDAAGRLYEQLGFQVGTRNRHPWGTENRLIQFATSFVELVTVGQGADIEPHGSRAFSFGAFVRDHLARREGLAMVVLSTADATADAAAFAKAGIGDFEPFRFARQGRRPDGSDVEVAFTLAFASDPSAPHAGCFVCQHHFPENFWNGVFQRHPNRALNISAVAMTADAPEAHRPFLEAFTGTGATSPAGHDLSIPLERGRLEVVTPDDAAELYGSVEIDRHEPAWVAFAVPVADMSVAAARLDAGAIPYQHIGSRIVVPASAALGVAIAFEPA
jgi:hypothetical protein